MPFVDPETLPVLEPRPGWRGRFFHSEKMTFAYYEIATGAGVHPHHHPEEEVWHVLEGEVEITLDGSPFIVRPGPARPWSCRAASATRSVRSAQHA